LINLRNILSRRFLKIRKHTKLKRRAFVCPEYCDSKLEKEEEKYLESEDEKKGEGYREGNSSG
jgi:hypothetical protein